MQGAFSNANERILKFLFLFWYDFVLSLLEVKRGPAPEMIVK